MPRRSRNNANTRRRSSSRSPQRRRSPSAPAQLIRTNAVVPRARGPFQSPLPRRRRRSRSPQQ